MQPPPGWTAPDLISGIMAGISLLLSGVLTYLRWQERKPDVKVDTRIAPVPPDETVPRLIVEIQNRSKRNLFLREIALSSSQQLGSDKLWKGPPPTWRVETWPYETTVSYPHELIDADGITEILNLHQLAEFFVLQGRRDVVWFQVWVKDKMGNSYSSNLIRFNIEQWRKAGTRVTSPQFQAPEFLKPETLRTPIYESSLAVGQTTADSANLGIAEAKGVLDSDM